MKNKRSAYWLCQVLGWSSYCLIYLLFYYTIRTQKMPLFYHILFMDGCLGLIFTHIMCLVIRGAKVLQNPLPIQISYLFLLTVVFSFTYTFFSVYLSDLLYMQYDQQTTEWSNYMKKYSLINRIIRVTPQSLFLLLVWNFIYFTYHYIENSRAQMLDKVRLESLVKELELKTIKAHINPHFIFNALNSIRALVDENPQRARVAITELSNILRSSMQAEKAETTSLEKELNIVKDYLALEHIRFEDRLKIEYEIDEETLDQQVPPMMLQTLVENAIKHGISKQIEGGTVKVISDFVNGNHELVVENTGKLGTEVCKSGGFGLSSTYNRLKLLYGEKARFEIKDVNGNIVRARVAIPMHA
jgi:two-component system, LytTR family, sensor kinase